MWSIGALKHMAVGSEHNTCEACVLPFSLIDTGVRSSCAQNPNPRGWSQKGVDAKCGETTRATLPGGVVEWVS